MAAKHPIGPRPISRRGWAIIAAVAVAIAVALSLVVHFYNAEGGSRVVSNFGPTDQDAVLVTMEPVSVDATRDQAVMHLSMASEGTGLTDENGRLKENVRVIASGYNGVTEAKFLAGEPMGQAEITIGLQGEEANYPFDRHEGGLMISADTYTKNSDGSLTSNGDILVVLQGAGGVNGWDTVMTLDSAGVSFASVEFVFQRAFSTQAFAILILTLAVLLVVFALVVAILIFTRRRHIEAALLGWTASLLFALPLLRNYMPNGPPVGAAIDIFVYLWVIVMAIVAAVLVVAGWIGQKRDDLVVVRAKAGDHAP